MAESSHRNYHVMLPLAILALGAFLLLFRLDHRPFWQDEAETACLAKNVLKYGVPRAYDGVNIISQEERKEFDQDYLWRWSPWLQIYVAAAAFKIGGFTTYAGRFPFAVMGIACIWLVYRLVDRNFGNQAWACLAALLLATSVIFLLYSRQCRYYSMATFLTLINLYAFMEDWQRKTLPALLLVISASLMFYTNYLLFLSYFGPFIIAAFLLYYQEIPIIRTMKIVLAVSLTMIPGLFLFRLEQQAMMVKIWTFVPENFKNYLGCFFHAMFPLPVGLFLLWRWSRSIWHHDRLFKDPTERFILFLALIIVGNIIFLTPAPQGEFRYMVHLYPFCVIILGWVICLTWRYQKFSGALLALLLLCTNWLSVLPMYWLRLLTPPVHNDPHMLTYPNIPLKLYFTELFSSYPDVNHNIISFFKEHAKPSDIIITTYDDLPLQFYTPCMVLGGLQGTISLKRPPDWLILRSFTRWNRKYDLNESERVTRHLLAQPNAYRAITLPYEDEIFGNIPDPFYHRFIPPIEPSPPLVIYEKKSP